MTRDILGRPVLTAAELDAMTPEDRKEAFEARVVTDLAQLPADYLARVQADVATLVARRDAAQQEVPRAS